MTKQGKSPLKIESRMLAKSQKDQIKKAVTVFQKGGIVIFPTDTVYGIGCRVNAKETISRLYKIKKTPADQPFPILVSKAGQVKKLAGVTKAGERLIKRFWPGALTIILLSKKGNEKIGFRMPDSSVVKALIEGVSVPIVGTSANFHGSKPPKSYEELDPGFIKLADFVLKGECKLGEESTVVDATADGPKILRQGAVKLNK